MGSEMCIRDRGTYIFYGRIVYDKDSSDTDTNYCIIQMRKNNTEVGSFLSHYYGRGDYDYVDGHMLVTLAAADTMRVYIGGNATTIGGSAGAGGGGVGGNSGGTGTAGTVNTGGGAGGGGGNGNGAGGTGGSGIVMIRYKFQ